MRDCVVGGRCGSGRVGAVHHVAKQAGLGMSKATFFPIIRRVCGRIACKTLLYTHSIPLHSTPAINQSPRPTSSRM
jgi:hypothetical protein